MNHRDSCGFIFKPQILEPTWRIPFHTMEQVLENTFRHVFLDGLVCNMSMCWGFMGSNMNNKWIVARRCGEIVASPKCLVRLKITNHTGIWITATTKESPAAFYFNVLFGIQDPWIRQKHGIIFNLPTIFGTFSEAFESFRIFLLLAHP